MAGPLLVLARLNNNKMMWFNVLDLVDEIVISESDDFVVLARQYKNS